MIDRRTFLAGTGAVLLAAPLAAGAPPQQKRPRIGLLLSQTPTADILGPHPPSPNTRGFLEGMRELGWVDGENITIERRSAEGRPDRYLPLVQEMLTLNVEIIVVAGAKLFVVTAQQATKTTPIVMVGLGGDPVQLGLVKSFARPAGNVTGSTFTIGPLNTKRLELLKEASPRVSRVAFLGAPDSIMPRESTARALKITMLSMPPDADGGVAGMFAAITQKRADALFVGGTTTWAHHREIIDFAAKHRLPAIYQWSEFTTAGGLMSYGADYAGIWRRAAAYVNKILRGAKPGDLPVEQPTKFELVINLKTAKALGLTIPPLLLAQADEVIQ